MFSKFALSDSTCPAPRTAGAPARPPSSPPSRASPGSSSHAPLASAHPSTGSPMASAPAAPAAAAAATTTTTVAYVRPGQTHACEECRRRKSKCDQAKPICSRCRVTGKADKCVYLAQKPRIVPSQRAVNELAASLQQCRDVLDRLFPADAMARLNLDPAAAAAAAAAPGPSSGDPDTVMDSLDDDDRGEASAAARRSPPAVLRNRQALMYLHSLPASQLLSLAQSMADAHPPPAPDDDVTARPERVLPALRKAPALHSDHNKALEQLRVQEDPNEFDEGDVDCEADDVNALGLTANKTTSYVGSSSVSAALRVIAVLCPSVMKRDPLRAESISSSSRSTCKDMPSFINVRLPSDREHVFLNAYFYHIHPIVPMINEARFRHDYTTGIKQNSSWCALLNMVLCLGSIAGQTAQNTEHLIYYQRARQHLNYDSFGSGRIETVQALALLGGWYYHYCHRPNVAMTVSGAAVRMAYALGLHCLSPLVENPNDAGTKRTDPDYAIKVKTWWCVVCLDIWGSTTVGRPSMPDYFGPAVTTPRPTYAPLARTVREWEVPLSAHEEHQLDMTQLAAELSFCEISAKIQDRLAIAPSLSQREMDTFDSELQLAYMQMPAMLRAPHPCPEFLEAPRAILKWRFLNARYLLRRPVLLAAAMDRQTVLTKEDRRSIDTCRAVVREVIMEIAREWKPNHFCGWHAAWNLFQATFVPLVSLYYEPDSPACQDWRRQVECSCSLFNLLTKWSSAAERTRQVLEELLEGSDWMRSPPPAAAPGHRVQMMVDNWQAFHTHHSWADNLLDNMDEPLPLSFDPGSAPGPYGQVRRGLLD